MCQWVNENAFPLLWMSSAPWSSSCAFDTRRHASPLLWFSVAKTGTNVLAPGPVIGGQVCGRPPISTEKVDEKKAPFVETTTGIWPHAEWSWRAKSTMKRQVGRSEVLLVWLVGERTRREPVSWVQQGKCWKARPRESGIQKGIRIAGDWETDLICFCCLIMKKMR